MLSVFSVQGQEVTRLEVLTVNEGLPTREIIRIAQDHKGLMWFGTSQGLIRYDGSRFKLYDSNPQNPSFIPEERITLDMFFQSAHELFYVADDQLFSLNIKNDSLRAFTEADGIRGDVRAITQDGKGVLWLVGDDKLLQKQYLIKYQEGRFFTVAEQARGDREFTSLAVDRQGDVYWSTVLEGISRYNDQGELLSREKVAAFDWFGKTMYFIESLFDAQNRQYIFPKSRGGVDRLDPNGKRVQVLTTPEEIDDALEDNEGKLWFAAENQLYCLNREGKIIDYTDQLAKVIDYSNIKHLFQDQAGLLWIGTDGGLVKMEARSSRFENLFTGQQRGWGKAMRSIFKTSDGRLFAMSETDQALLVRDQSGEERRFRLQGISDDVDSPLHNARQFVLSTDGQYAYTVSHTLVRIDLQTGSVKTYPETEPYLDVTNANPLLRLSDGRLLLGNSLNHLLIFDPETEKGKSVFQGAEYKVENLRVFHESKQTNQVWIGTLTHGLFRVDLDGQVLENYTVNSVPPLAKNKINALFEDENEGLWAGTFGGGVNYLNATRDSVTVYKIQDGLADNNIVGIEPFEDDQLWIATYNGLSNLNTETGAIRNFFEKDGLSHHEFNVYAHFKDEDGYYYFGGMNGVNRFRSEEVIEHVTLPALHFTNVVKFEGSQNRESTLELTYQELPELYVAPQDQYFTVKWSLPHYLNHENHRYHTWLEGYEDRWQYQGNSNFVRYNKLPAGSYTLKVRGTDARGNPSATAAALQIHIARVFYKTWWFMALCLVLLGFMVYLYFQFRLRQLLKLERLRTKISSDLHDDVGSLLSGLSMQTELLEMTAREEDKDRLAKIGALSRKAVSQMRDLVWSIDSRREKVSDLIERMQELAEERLLPLEITFNIETRNLQMHRKLPLQTKQHLFLIFKEAVTNMVKHSDATHLEVLLQNASAGAKIEITDNGNVAGKEKSSGLGLSNMRYRVDQMKGVIAFNRKKGFVIDISLPFDL